MQFVPMFGNFAFMILAFIVALSVIVAIHEYGHYIVGRWCGIHADVFSLGFGPVLWSRMDKRGTRWQIALLPFGGYVKFLGDADAASAGQDAAVMADAAQDPAELRRTMHGAPLWARSATVAAGYMVAAALVLAIAVPLSIWAPDVLGDVFPLLAIIAVMLGLSAAAVNVAMYDTYTHMVAMPASVLIALVAVYWVIERVFL